MERAQTHPLPAHDPVSGGTLVITEIEGVDTGVTIRGRFEMPRFARLSPEQGRFLETFLRCRGMLNSVERELGISYPTARARLDAVLKALDLHPTREEDSSTPAPEPQSEESVEASFDGMATEDAFYIPETQEPPAPTADDPAFETLTVKESVENETPKPSRLEVLGMLERGEITPERAKELLGVAK